VSTELPKRVANADADPAVPCTITKIQSIDEAGRPVLGETRAEECSVLKLPGDDSDISSRIGSSPEHPLVPTRREDAVLLLRITTKAKVDDLIDVAGIRLRATTISPSYDSVGKLAFYVAQGVVCDPPAEDVGPE
jgi:hypothetical protein